GVVPHHLAAGELLVTSGQGVVADIGDSLRAKMARAQRQNALLHGLGNPGIQTVTDDVVKRSQAVVELGEIRAAQLEIPKSQLRDHRLTVCDLPLRQIDADEATARQ